MAATVQKVSVALGREELEWARKRAKRQRTSVSAVLTDITREARETEARRARQRRAWTDFLASAVGDRPLDDAELAAARAELADE